MAKNWCDEENLYYLSNLNLPKIKNDVQCKPSNTGAPKIYNFSKTLEDIFGEELKVGNPWFNGFPSKNWKKKYAPTVRFYITEIHSGELPHCRTRAGNVSRERLHAADCVNASHESLEILGSRVCLNRSYLFHTETAQTLALPQLS